VLVPTVVLPNPTLAKAITVTGIVQIGSSRQAIVRSPLEPSSRYVSPGQRIANGQVLVKRIEVRGSEPVVVLEESGIEVVKFIGQPAELAPTTPDSTEQQNGSA
jgi:molybdopterin biosynthesis enzyme